MFGGFGWGVLKGWCGREGVGWGREERVWTGREVGKVL